MNINFTFLEAFLFINVFVIGGLLALAIQHAYFHYKHKDENKKKSNPKDLPLAAKKRLIKASEDKFQRVIDHSADQLENDLSAITGRVDQQVEKLSSDIIYDETRRYKAGLDDLRKQTELAMVSAQKEITDHQQQIKNEVAKQREEMESKLAEEIAAKKQQMITDIDTKLNDAVASFLVETLGHNVDLGAQSDYLIEMLEQHKAELKKGVSDEA